MTDNIRRIAIEDMVHSAHQTLRTLARNRMGHTNVNIDDLWRAVQKLLKKKDIHAHFRDTTDLKLMCDRLGLRTVQKFVGIGYLAPVVTQITVFCQTCGGERRINPQDVSLVTRCVLCQEAERRRTKRIGAQEWRDRRKALQAASGPSNDGGDVASPGLAGSEPS